MIPFLAARAVAALAVVLAIGANAAPCRAQSPDSLRFRIEAGGSTDFTNERFYETFDDTTFRRGAVDSPQARYAGVLLTALDGLRGGGTSSFQLLNELSLGDLLSREALGLRWRTDFTPESRLSFDPRLEYRRDRTLDRDLEEWRGTAGVRYRRTFIERFQSVELAARGEMLRSHGTGSEFLLDRDVASVRAAFEQASLERPEWQLGGQFTARLFPDSTVRDHLEYGWEGSLHAPAAASWAWQIESSGERRVTVDFAPTSRDNFWQERGAADLEWRTPGLWGGRARLEGEALQYDLQDSTLYFNYQTVRLTAGPKLGGIANWSVWIAPRVEALFSGWNPGESYREAALGVELEATFRRSWWSLTPAGGWRSYGDDPVSLQQGIPSLLSSYAFFELTTFIDQAVPGGLRLRCIADGRLEAHEDDSQDASSLYFSLDLRKIF